MDEKPPTPERKIKCVKVCRPDTHGGKYCLYTIEGFSARDEFDGAEDGEEITLTLCEMTQEEYDAIPDFDGW